MRAIRRRNGNNLCRFFCRKWMSAHFIICFLFLSVFLLSSLWDLQLHFGFGRKFFARLLAVVAVAAAAAEFFLSQLHVIRLWTHSENYELCGKWVWLCRNVKTMHTDWYRTNKCCVYSRLDNLMPHADSHCMWWSEIWTEKKRANKAHDRSVQWMRSLEYYCKKWLETLLFRRCIALFFNLIHSNRTESHFRLWKLKIGHLHRNTRFDHQIPSQLTVCQPNLRIYDFTVKSLRRNLIQDNRSIGIW